MAARDSAEHENIVIGRHYPELDGLRAVAILLVMWWHASNIAYNGDGVGGYINAYHSLSFIGAGGVTLFFVLSGFLITGILIDTAHHKKRLTNFYIRRSLRIFPLYYVSIIILMLSSWLFLENWKLDLNVLYFALYVANWTPLINGSMSIWDDNYMFFKHFWSLAVEEQFYLVWPFFFLAFYKKCEPKIAVAICLIIILLSVLFRIYISVYMGGNQISYILTLSRLDALVMGGALALIVANKHEIGGIHENFKTIIFVMGVFWLILFLPLIFLSYANLILIEGIVYTLLLSVCILRPNNVPTLQVLRIPIFPKIAKHSYALYILHLPIMYIMFMHIEQFGMPPLINHLIVLVGGMLCSYCAALLAYDSIEKPFLKLKDKWAPYDNA